MTAPCTPATHRKRRRVKRSGVDLVSPLATAWPVTIWTRDEDYMQVLDTRRVVPYRNCPGLNVNGFQTRPRARLVEWRVQSDRSAEVTGRVRWEWEDGEVTDAADDL